MGMFDEIRAINITHTKFNILHNGPVFQTKSLDCDMSEYCVFNGVLYRETDNSGVFKRFDHAVKVDFSGELNLYTTIRKDGIEFWVEYDLVLDSGIIVDVIASEPVVMSDNRDLSAQRPCQPNNRVEVTISVSGCTSEKQKAFAESIDDNKIEAIRVILGEPKATVFYPVKSPIETGWQPQVLTIASVVQSLEDLQTSDVRHTQLTAPNGDRILIIDEFHN